MLPAFIILSGSSAASWSLSIVNNEHTTGASNILQGMYFLHLHNQIYLFLYIIDERFL